MSSIPYALDPYRPGNSFLHDLDARVKLALTLLFILVSAFLPVGAWPAYVLMAALVWSWALLSSLGIGFVLKRSLIVIPFVLAALPLPFTLASEVTWPIHVFGLELTLGLAGIERLLTIALKSWLSVQSAILLAATTRLPDLLVALRWLHVPRLLVMVIGLMWRYMFLLVEEAARLLRARQARSGASHSVGSRAGGSLLWRARVAGGMAGGLFLRSIERSERVYAAMLARGYDGTPRSLPQPAPSRRDWVTLFAGSFVLLLLLALGLLLGG
ncbi:MAG: cobalt ECF transporter T component CbiQ [Anaerolineales bacterium]|nr:cobalt ECF transporter T component CbiQ [Anaerolineales bacterium]